MKSLYRSLLASLLFCTGSIAVSAESIRVVFLSPDPPGNPFWDSVVGFMHAVAEDLSIDLEVHIGKTGASGTYMMKKNGMKLLKGPEFPDYFVTGYWPGATNQLIKVANSNRVKFFVINTPIAEDDQAIVGKPREKYRHWIGHMSPNEIQAGYTLTETLVRAASAHTKSKVRIGGLGGNTDSAVSAMRVKGFKNYIEENSSTELLNIYSTDWSKPATLIATDKLLTNHPDTHAIWAAADSIALYASIASRNVGRDPGSDIFLAGIDWSDEGIQAVEAGILAGSIGGHFMEGGWALLLIHDYHHNIDFKEELGTSIQTTMQLIDKDNVQEYLAIFGDRDWSRIDFKKFSKVYNKSLEQYDFSLDQLFRQLK